MHARPLSIIIRVMPRNSEFGYFLCLELIIIIIQMLIVRLLW